jgi:hypothetical protein
VDSNLLTIRDGVAIDGDTGDLLVDQAFGELRNNDLVDMRSMIASQHPLDALMFQVFEDLGGHVFLMEWAHANPSKFFQLFFKMKPGLMPSAGMIGDVNIQIHNDLGRSPLDEIEVSPA